MATMRAIHADEKIYPKERIKRFIKEAQNCVKDLNAVLNPSCWAKARPLADPYIKLSSMNDELAALTGQKVPLGLLPYKDKGILTKPIPLKKIRQYYIEFFPWKPFREEEVNMTESDINEFVKRTARPIDADDAAKLMHIFKQGIQTLSETLKSVESRAALCSGAHPRLGGKSAINKHFFCSTLFEPRIIEEIFNMADIHKKSNLQQQRPAPDPAP